MLSIAAAFQSLSHFAASGNKSHNSPFVHLRYVHQWLHSGAGAGAAVVGRRSGSGGSRGQVFIDSLHQNARTRKSAPSRRQLRGRLGGMSSSGLEQPTMKRSNGTQETAEFRSFRGPRSPAARAHVEGFWPPLPGAQYCHDVSNQSCAWGFKSPASVLSIGGYAQLLGANLHFVHVVRDIRDMLSPRSHSFIQTRKFYDAVFWQVCTYMHTCEEYSRLHCHALAAPHIMYKHCARD